MALPAGLTVPARPPAPHPADTATPTLSRRHAAGAPSARGLLLTLLGEFVLTGDETAWTSAVLATFGGLGIEEKTTRQALMRTAAAGWLDAEKLGRRTRWRLTAAARRMLTDGAARIYSFTGPDPDWDGRWLLISARIPESDRRARHVLRTRLSWAGFGSSGRPCGSARTRTGRPKRSGCCAKPGSRTTRTCSWPGGPGWATSGRWWPPPGT